MRTPQRSPLHLLLVGMIFVAITGCQAKDQKSHHEIQDAGAKSPFSLRDAPIAGFQGELLELAFQAASRMPVDPHIKTRSKLQEEVVNAALELGQLQRALGYSKTILNWRKGTAYASVAYHAAERGANDGAREILDLALLHVAALRADENTQDWQRDRIRSRAAQALVVLGEADRAKEVARGIDASEAGRVEAEVARRLPSNSLDDGVEGTGSLLASGQFDQIQYGLDASLRLLQRGDVDVKSTEKLITQILDSSKKLPQLLRVELQMKLADAFLSRPSGKTRGLEFLADVRKEIERSKWLLEDRLTIDARVASLQHRALETEAAKTGILNVLERYEAGAGTIVDIYRSRVLRAIAEGLHQMGDVEASQRTFEKALIAAIQNQNSRPRTEDFCALCSSMAIRTIEPDAALWKRIRAVDAVLGEPW